MRSQLSNQPPSGADTADTVTEPTQGVEEMVILFALLTSDISGDQSVDSIVPLAFVGEARLERPLRTSNRICARSYYVPAWLLGVVLTRTLLIGSLKNVSDVSFSANTFYVLSRVSFLMFAVL
jgi:hypothetical protein